MPTIIDISEAEPQVVELATAAVQARGFAYCPYSNFAVGAAARDTDDAIYQGCNVENSLYSAAICAERTALVKAVSQGKKTFKAIAVCADQGSVFTSPCGLCRQFLIEFGDDIEVYLVKPDMKQVLLTNIEELLPLSFHLLRDSKK